MRRAAILVFVTLASVLLPLQGTAADQANPPTSDIDNYVNFVVSPAAKQGMAIASGATLLNTNTGSFSVEAWVNPSESMTSLNGTIFLKQDSVALRSNNLRLEVYLNNGSWASYQSAYYLRTNEWQHVALVKSGTTLYIYVNGSLVYQNASVYANISSNTKYLGFGGDSWDGSANQASPQSTLWAGGMDEVRVWGTARSQLEIQNNMNQKISGSSSGLLAYWDCNGTGSTSTLYDRVGSFNLTIFGSPAFPDVKTTVLSVGYATVTFPRSYLNATGTFTIPSGVSSVSVLVVGGGGGGGFDGGGGGGGGGVYQNSNLSVTAGNSYQVKVGGGGPAINGYVGGTFCTGGWGSTVVGCLSGGGNGSAFGSISASGGGGGGGIESNGGADSNAAATTRGGGGGGGSQNSKSGATSGGAGAFSGGASSDGSGNAGGGGASSIAAGSSTGNTLAGNGATGVTANLDSLVYGSGGGGGSYNNTNVAPGGSGAGSGGANSLTATKPVANRGGGGGGGGSGAVTASSGAAGIVILRYALSGSATLSIPAAPIYRSSSSITATTNTASRVTFYANGKRIANCIKVLTVSLVATCSWKPSIHGSIAISILITPLDSNFTASTVKASAVIGGKRTGTR